MSQMKLIEKILSNREYCEKIAAMTLEEFKAALAQRGAELKDVEKAYRIIMVSVAGGELDDEELEAVAGGMAVTMCELYEGPFGNSSGC